MTTEKEARPGGDLSASRPPFPSIWACVGLSAAAGVLGLLLIRVVPVGTDHEYLARYAIWAREVKELFEACGKHEPRDLDCVIRHPVRPKP